MKFLQLGKGASASMDGQIGKTPIRIHWTCCAACHAEHTTLWGARLHFWRLAMAAKLRGPDPPDSLQIVGDIRRLELRPGDALAMQFQFPLTDQTVERVLSTLEAKFPGHKCIVMDKGTDLVVVPAAEASAR